MVKRRNRKIPIWIPYVNEITWKKNNVMFEFKGGMLDMRWNRILSIMFYGAVCPLEEKFLEHCVRYSISICIHRRNMHRAIWIGGSWSMSDKDILTRQIKFRENEKKSLHIARKILLAKIRSMEWLSGKSPVTENRLKSAKSVDELRGIEAAHAKRYWVKYYLALGFKRPERRNRNNDVSATLNAVSKFVSGIMMRYIIFHKMSVYHGFLHQPVSYPALIYDLVEPYRGHIDKCVFDALHEVHDDHMERDKMVSCCINAVKDLMNKNVYTHQTRQVVTFQELLHGSVLALRAYLIGEASRYIVPIPGRPSGGRPLQTGYRLYGRQAGPMNFYQEADKIADDWNLEVDRGQ